MPTSMLVAMPRQVCRFFNSPNGCAKGGDCPFTHGHRSDHPTAIVCKNFDIDSQAGCSFGDKCHFLHLPRHSGFSCSECSKRIFHGICHGCVKRPMVTRSTSKMLQDLADQSDRADALHFALIQQKDDHTIYVNEMNAVLDSLHTTIGTQTENPKHTFTGTQTESNLCGICCDRPVSHALVPCGHAYCLVCIEASTGRCPNCRDPFQSMLAIFI
jgi:hypothetical protein